MVFVTLLCHIWCRPTWHK